MNNNSNIPLWKKITKWIWLALLSLVVIDWLFDGRLRERLPLHRHRNRQQPPVE